MLLAGSAASAQLQQPNHVLFILIDDLGYADVGYHGCWGQLDHRFARVIRLYYVASLCSPTRTSLLMGWRAYNIGMNAEVIVNGQPSQMPLSARTIADRLQVSGWATAIYFKWDAGMTSWGCAPTCRGFDHFFGFYDADEDHFSHLAGKYLDLRNDIRRLRAQQSGPDADKPSFTYFAHQAIHGPIMCPVHYYLARNSCPDIPDSSPRARWCAG